MSYSLYFINNKTAMFATFADRPLVISSPDKQKMVSLKKTVDAQKRIQNKWLNKCLRFYHENERLEMMEASPELASLREWLNQVQNRRHLSEKERLERDLAEAIRLEDYERAARVRDQIRKMQASGS